MIIPEDIKSIINAVSQGHTLSNCLKALKIKPLAFFKYLKTDSIMAAEFEHAKQCAIELEVESMQGKISDSANEFELKKALALSANSKWLAEKLIPRVYGARVDVNVHKTIDIVGILDEARKRIKNGGENDDGGIPHPLPPALKGSR